MVVRPHRWWAMLLWLSVLALSTCGSLEAPAPAVTTVVVEQPESPTTLILWHAWPSPEQHILATLIDRYNQARPDIQVIPQAMPLATLTNELRVAALVGSGPHLVLLQSHTIGSLSREGLLLPLDESMISAEERERLLSTALQGASAPDSSGALRLYGLPLAFDTLALYYHRGQVQQPPPSTDMLLDTAYRLTKTNEQPPVWGLAYTLSLDKTIGYLPAFGGQVFDEQGQIVLGKQGRTGTEQWLQWLLELRQDDKILAVRDSIAVDSALKAQKALMTIDWSHALANYQALWGENLGVAVLPDLSATNQPPQPYVQSDVLSINARMVDRTEQQAALDFARYLLSIESQRALLDVGKQPVLLNLELRGNTPAMEAARIFRRQAEQGQPMPNSAMVDAIVREELERMQGAVLLNVATPADAVTFADSVLREQLNRPPEP